MPKERVREWEKGPSEPIPINKLDRFREKLSEHSERFSERNIMLFNLGVGTGYRLGDIVGLTIGQIEDALDGGEFIIQESKQHEQWRTYKKNNPDSSKKKPDKRRVVIKSKLRKYLEKYVEKKKRSEYAFPSNKGKGNEHITAKSYSLELVKVGKSIGLDNISGHSLRKTYATIIYEEFGNDIDRVSKALGHKSINETRRYLRVKDRLNEESNGMVDKYL